MDNPGQVQPPVITEQRRAEERRRGWIARCLIILLLVVAVLLTRRDWDGCMPCSACHGRAFMVRYYLMTGHDVNERRGGYTSLMEAVWYGYPNIVDLLVQHGANLDLPDDLGDTVLIWSAKEGHEKDVAYFIDKGASLNLTNALGDTAIICAMRNGYPSVARLLLNAGADINLENKNGGTVLMAAGKRGYGDMVELFEEHGALKTNVFIGSSPYPTKALSKAHLWALATRALLVQYNGDSHEALGSTADGEQGWAQRQLHDWWSIDNHDDAVRKLTWLKETGQREWYQSNDSRPRKKGERRVRYLAWDYCRLNWVASRSFVAGYLTEEEAWQWIMPSAREIQASFSSWREMGEDYLRGRERWNQDRDPRFDYILGLLTNPDDPTSPWNKNKWDTNLSE